MYYLPDFLLHNVVIQNGSRSYHPRYNADLWVEVKGSMNREDAEKIMAFAGYYSEDYCYKVEGFEHPIIILSNIPSGNSIIEIDRCIGSFYFDYGFDEDSFSSPNDIPDYLSVQPFDFAFIDDDPTWTAYPCINKQGNFSVLGIHDFADRDELATEKAYRIARQARFEHNQSPKYKDVVYQIMTR